LAAAGGPSFTLCGGASRRCEGRTRSRYFAHLLARGGGWGSCSFSFSCWREDGGRGFRDTTKDRVPACAHACGGARSAKRADARRQNGLRYAGKKKKCLWCTVYDYSYRAVSLLGGQLSSLAGRAPGFATRGKTRAGGTPLPRRTVFSSAGALGSSL